MHARGALTADRCRRIVREGDATIMTVESVGVVAELLEAEQAGEQPLLNTVKRAPGSHALDADDGLLGGDLGVRCGERRIGFGCDHQLDPRTVRVDQSE
jgi:hypothetical protein